DRDEQPFRRHREAGTTCADFLPAFLLESVQEDSPHYALRGVEMEKRFGVCVPRQATDLMTEFKAIEDIDCGVIHAGDFLGVAGDAVAPLLPWPSQIRRRCCFSRG